MTGVVVTGRSDRRMRAVRLAQVAGMIALAATGCDGADDRSAEFSYVHAAILAPSCATAGCHSKLTAQAGIDLSTVASAYVFLTGQVCGGPEVPGEPEGNYVVPFAPERSKLVYQLRGIETRVMPPDLPLPEVQIQIIERWIEAGAACD